jgi:hypothetical protein
MFRPSFPKSFAASGISWIMGRMNARRIGWGVLFGILTICLCLISAPAQQKEKFSRLVLTDGSYERISQYQIHGDRVRYFSSERNEWEEIPYSLVDWAATEKFAVQAAKGVSERKSEDLERASAERGEDEVRFPLVAPGIRLPSPDGVYLLDVFQDVPELIALSQNGADLNKNTGSNILRGIINPVAGPKQTIELKGPNALIQAHVLLPAVYFPMDPGDPSAGYDSTTAKDHLRVVRCREKDGNRVVVALNIAIYGKVKQQADYVGVKVEPVSEYWLKISPSVQLKPGEYALVEFDGKGRMNEFVWDFGVNPGAPPNPDVVAPTQDRNEPILIQKSKKKPNP